MEELKNKTAYCGIDVSKSSFDVYCQDRSYVYENANKVMVKLEAGREQETLERLQQFYLEYNPRYPFEYHFMDENYKALYAAEQRVSTLSKYFGGLAILISCLGLYGLAAFTAERRMKEIGIRKILGSGYFGIISL